MTPADSQLQPETLVGQYRVVRLLDRGGRGEVYLARDTRLGRAVALKVAAAADQQRLEQFLGEARTTARLNHPNIITIYGAGEHDGRPYLALELVQGTSLRDRMEQGVETGEALHILVSVCRGLQQAHALGVVHRDLKPENVMIGRDGRVRLVDFGLSVLAQSAADDTPAGTPAYMAPEQWLGAASTAAIDCWALGVMLHELLAGRRPYGDVPPDQQRDLVLEPGPVPLGPIEQPLLEVVSDCLAKQPEQRPAAADVANAIELAIKGPTQSAAQPYPGLQAFGRQDAWRFFGREEETDALVEQLRHHPTLLLVGPSGSGKTSLIQAGLLARLTRRWVVLEVRPGDHPLQDLARSLEPWVSTASEQPQRTDLARLLGQAPAMLGLLLEQVAQQQSSQVLLVVDGLEQVRSESQHTSLVEAALGASTDGAGPVRVMLVLRDDWLGRVASLPAPVRGALARARITLLGCPTPASLRHLLEAPLRDTGFRFEDEALVEQMVGEISGRPAGLPLLQFTARALWDRRDRAANLLRRSDYEAIGGVAGALAKHADTVLDALPPVLLPGARKILLRLVTSEGDSRPLAEEELLDGMGARASETLERLVQGRLVVVQRADARTGRGDHEPQGADSDNGERSAELELAHESLMRSWGRLRSWLHEDRMRLGLTEELEQAARLWRRRGSLPQELWRGDALAEARRLLEGQSLSEQASRFLEEGTRRHGASRRHRAVLAASLAVAVMLLFGWLVWPTPPRQPDKPPTHSDSWANDKIAAARRALTRGNRLEARQLASAALAVVDSPQARVVLWRLGRREVSWKRPLPAVARSLTTGPDGTVAATLDGGDIRLLDAQGDLLATTTTSDATLVAPVGGQIVTVASHREIRASPSGRGATAAAIVTAIAAGPRQLLALGHADGAVRLRRLPSLAPAPLAIAPCQAAGRGSSAVTALAFSPDGRQLAIGTADHQICICGLDTPLDPCRPLTGHRARVTALAFGPLSRTLASGSHDGEVRTWVISSGRIRHLLDGRGHPVLQLVLGSTRLAARTRAAVHLWDRARGEELERLQLESTVVALGSDPDQLLQATAHDLQLISLTCAPQIERGHRDAVNAVSIDASSQLVASAGVDGTVRIWDGHSGQQQQVLIGHAGAVNAVSFSPDGALVASGGDDLAVRLWDRRRGTELAVLTGHVRRVLRLRHSPVGGWLASAGADGTVRIWQAGPGRRDRPARDAVIRAHRAPVLDLDISPDGTRLATCGADRMVRLWQVTAEKQTLLHDLAGHRSRVTSVAFHPHGAHLASASNDGAVWLWRLNDPSTPHASLPATPGTRARLAFLADGRLVVMGSNGAQICKESNGWRCRSLPLDGDEFAANGAWIALGRPDGAVVLVDSRTMRPAWRERLSVPGLTAPGAGARQRVELAALAAASRRLLCLWDYDDRLEAWDIASDRKLWGRTAFGLQRLDAVGPGCVTLSDLGTAELHSALQERVLATAATAVAVAPGPAPRILVASRRGIEQFDRTGSPVGRRDAPPGVTALLPWRGDLALGMADGAIELMTGRTRQRLRGGDGVAVTALAAGPAGTLFAGQASGELQGWLVDRRWRFWRAKLHGPIGRLSVEGHVLGAATEVGDRLRLDLGQIDEDHGRLTKKIGRWERMMRQSGLPRVVKGM